MTSDPTTPNPKLVEARDEAWDSWVSLLNEVPAQGPFDHFDAGFDAGVSAGSNNPSREQIAAVVSDTIMARSMVNMEMSGPGTEDFEIADAVLSLLNTKGKQ